MTRHLSIVERRRFLGGLLATAAGFLAATLLAPLGRYLVPPTPEPEAVELPLDQVMGMGPLDVLRFAWGSKPGLLQRRADGFRAYVGVCTHLDCNVTWEAAPRRFYCACHDGWYDADGINVAGPPPTPLRRLRVDVEADAVVVRRLEEAT